MRRLTALALLALSLAAGARDLPPTVRSALAKAGIPAAAAHVVVEPVEQGLVPVFHEAAAPVNPASAMKVITAYAALDLLGPAFTFHTDILAAGELENGVLRGDLVIRGGGDPKLTYERVWQLAHRLRDRGVREIRGDVVIDRGYFALPPHDPGLFDQEPRRAYNVGADALLVNFQAIDFRFVPGEKGVRVLAEPSLPNLEIASSIEVAEGPCGAWRHGLSHEVRQIGLIATIFFRGAYPAACGERSWPLAVFDGPAFTEATLRWIWSEVGGVLRGRVREGPAPEGARLLLRHESEPLSTLVRDMNKFSNNVMARHLFLALSAVRGGRGEAAASAAIVLEWLLSRGIEAPELVLENGSGLSRDERVSAGTLAAVLRNAWASPVMPELAASFPVLAVDGTLRNRGAGPVHGRAHLKGGTLNGVQSVAGYVLDKRGRRWVVVMIVNDPRANAAGPAIDALLAWVHEGPTTRSLRRTR